jgi:hypothetical protein
MKRSKPCTGDIVTVNGRKYCVGEKIISKWKLSKRNRRVPKKRTTAKRGRKPAAAKK